jgi:hypothetical protein
VGSPRRGRGRRPSYIANDGLGGTWQSNRRQGPVQLVRGGRFGLGVHRSAALSRVGWVEWNSVGGERWSDGELEMEGIGRCGREGQNRPKKKRCNWLKKIAKRPKCQGPWFSEKKK